MEELHHIDSNAKRKSKTLEKRSTTYSIHLHLVTCLHEKPVIYEIVAGGHVQSVLSHASNSYAAFRGFSSWRDSILPKRP